MIISKLFSGLGNQMFQYAIARSLAIKNKTDVWLDTIGFVNDNHRKYSLDAFDVDCKLVDGFNQGMITMSIWDKVGFKNYQVNYYNDKIWEFNNVLQLDKSKFIYLSGYWVWPGYFENVTTQIRKDFRLKNFLEPA